MSCVSGMGLGSRTFPPCNDPLLPHGSGPCRTSGTTKGHQENVAGPLQAPHDVPMAWGDGTNQQRRRHMSRQLSNAGVVVGLSPRGPHVYGGV